MKDPTITLVLDFENFEFKEEKDIEAYDRIGRPIVMVKHDFHVILNLGFNYKAGGKKYPDRYLVATVKDIVYDEDLNEILLMMAPLTIPREYLLDPKNGWEAE